MEIAKLLSFMFAGLMVHTHKGTDSIAAAHLDSSKLDDCILLTPTHLKI